ncbi:MAG: CPBP family intramembrane metalloprotease [Candidatus Schekmanbacteria bacterium]|nr:CPBP family intramembrane metalloprotease [Candidatus Schekmanbacteria bacterium]
MAGNLHARLLLGGAAAMGLAWAAASLPLAAWPIAILPGALLLVAAAGWRPLARWLGAHYGIDTAEPAHAAFLVAISAALFLLLSPLGAAFAGLSPPRSGSMADIVGLQVALSALAIWYYGLAGGGAAALGPEMGCGRRDIAAIVGRGLATGAALLLVMELGGWLLVAASQRFAAGVGYTANEDVTQLLPWLRQRSLLELALITVAAAVGEELFFRGVLQKGLGNVPTSTIFAVAHLGHGALANVVGAFLYSLGLGKLRSATRSLAAPMIAHGLIDGVQLLVLLPLSGQLGVSGG